MVYLFSSLERLSCISKKNYAFSSCSFFPSPTRKPYEVSRRHNIRINNCKNDYNTFFFNTTKQRFRNHGLVSEYWLVQCCSFWRCLYIVFQCLRRPQVILNNRSIRVELMLQNYSEPARTCWQKYTSIFCSRFLILNSSNLTSFAKYRYGFAFVCALRFHSSKWIALISNYKTKSSFMIL